MKKATLLLGALLVATVVSAQDPQTGFPPYSSFANGQFDAINHQNLNVNFGIPIVSSPGRGADLNFAITYNSLIWQKLNNTWAPVTDSNGFATWGWNKDQVIGELHFNTITNFCPIDWDVSIRVTNHVFVDDQGTRHPFDVTYYVATTACEGGPGPPVSGHATDGSGYLLDVPATGPAVVIAPDGTRFENNGGVQIDPNGNKITGARSSSEDGWTDTLGRLTLKIKRPTSTKVEYHVLDKAGGYQITTMNLTTFNIKTNFACPGVTEYTGMAVLPTSINLPNGQSYTLTYEDTPGFAGYKSGRLKRATLPTGGFYEYTYPTTANKGINCDDGTVVELTRKIDDGSSSVTWDYSRAQAGSNWETTVTAPQLPYDTAGNRTVFTFNSDDRLISQEIYQGTSTLLRTTQTTWTSEEPFRPVSTVVILEDDQQAKTETTLDEYGNLTELKEYDWGQGAPGSLVRTTTLTYLSTQPYTDRNILNRVSQRVVKDGAGTVKSLTDISYDSTTLTCVSGAAQHDDANYGCSFTTRGNPTAITGYTNPAVPSGGITRYFEYDSVGNVREADVECCQQKQWSYSATTEYAYPDSVISGPPGGPQLTTSATYNFHTGLVATSTDANSQTTSFSYDNFRRLTAISFPDGGSTTLSYDDVTRIITRTVKLDATQNIATESSFDGLGRLVQSRLTSDPEGTAFADTAYDALGRQHKVSNPYRTGDTIYYTATEYDALGRVVKLIPQDSNGTSNYVDVQYSGNCRTATDQAGKKRKSCSDALGRATSVWEPNSAGSFVFETVSQYDVLNNLIQVDQKGNDANPANWRTRSFVYDGLGRVTSATTPEGGTLSYVYNNFNLVTQRTDARGIQTTYYYDDLHRLTDKDYSNTTQFPDVTYHYDQSAYNGINPITNGIGRLTGMHEWNPDPEPDGYQAWSYDEMGRPLVVARTTNGIRQNFTYVYNLDGSLASVTYPGPHTVDYAYNAAGRAVTAIDSGNNINYVTQASYAPHGALESAKFGVVSGGFAGYTRTYEYNKRLQPEQITAATSTQTLLDLSYDYNLGTANNGSVMGIVNNLDNDRSQSFAYDTLNRLQTAWTQATAGPKCFGYEYTYDIWANLTNMGAKDTHTACTQESLNVTVNSKNQISSAGFVYDDAGNMTDDALNDYTYNAENRMTSGAGVTYTYDGLGRRVKKSSGTLYRHGLDGQVLVETTPGNTLLNQYIYFNGRRVARRTNAGTVYYYFDDHLGSARVMVQAGQTTKCYDADLLPFGYEKAYTDTCPQNYKFTGKESDGESDLTHFWFRDYSARLASWTTPDPVGGDAANPQSLNRYSYVGNDPLNAADPLGLFRFGVSDQYYGISIHVYGNHPGLDPLTRFWLRSVGGVAALAGGVGGQIRIPSRSVGTPGGVGALRDGLEEALSKPDCSALVGSIGAMLQQMLNLHDVGAPGFDRTKFSSSLAQRAIDLAQSGAVAATAPGPGFFLGSPIFVGASFNALSSSEQATVIIHEFRHQFYGSMGGGVPDRPDGQLQRESALISERCGTTDPFNR